MLLTTNSAKSVNYSSDKAKRLQRGWAREGARPRPERLHTLPGQEPGGQKSQAQSPELGDSTDPPPAPLQSTLHRRELGQAGPRPFCGCTGPEHGTPPTHTHTDTHARTLTLSQHTDTHPGSHPPKRHSRLQGSSTGSGAPCWSRSACASPQQTEEGRATAKATPGTWPGETLRPVTRRGEGNILLSNQGWLGSAREVQRPVLRGRPALPCSGAASRPGSRGPGGPCPAGLPGP